MVISSIATKQIYDLKYIIKKTKLSMQIANKYQRTGIYRRKRLIARAVCVVPDRPQRDCSHRIHTIHQRLQLATPLLADVTAYLQRTTEAMAVGRRRHSSDDGVLSLRGSERARDNGSGGRPRELGGDVAPIVLMKLQRHYDMVASDQSVAYRPLLDPIYVRHNTNHQYQLTRSGLFVGWLIFVRYSMMYHVQYKMYVEKTQRKMNANI